jgi:hypothetical protein
MLITNSLSWLKKNWKELVSLSTIILVVGFLSDSLGLFDKIRSWTKPNVELVYFVYDLKGYPIVNDSDYINIDLTNEIIESQIIEIPINLAFRNRGNERLEFVKLEIRYGRDLTVISNGTQKIDPFNNVIIYEHYLGTIENVESYTLIENVDILKIPFHFSFFPVLALSKDGVPLYYSVMVGSKENSPQKEIITLDLTLFCSNRKPINGKMVFVIKPIINYYLPSDISKFSTEDISEKEKDLFHTNIIERFDIVKHWKKQASDDLRYYEYFLVQDTNDLYQFILVDDQVRLVNVDHGKNHTIDYMIIDNNKDGNPNLIYTPNPAFPLINWEEKAIR